MIAIFSKRNFELSTEKVIDWLKYYKANFVRVNATDFYESLSYTGGKFDMLPQDINVCWFRRWMDEDYLSNKIITGDMDKGNMLELNMHLSLEAKVLNNHLWSSLKNKQWLTDPNREFGGNKLFYLKEAKKHGLDVPDTLITHCKERLIAFKEKHRRVISKSIGEPVFFFDNDKGLSLKTIEVTDQLLAEVPDRFFPSLFQELIEKEFEIRSFFLDGKFYSMAIFSQLDEQTAIDFRNYNKTRPNRYVPYKLPEDIESKLLNFLRKAQISTGSLDIIKASDGRYVFLEINLVGQFGMTSMPCNYALDKAIANYLMKRDVSEKI